MDDVALRTPDEAGSDAIRPRVRGAHAAPKGSKPEKLSRSERRAQDTASDAELPNGSVAGSVAGSVNGASDGSPSGAGGASTKKVKSGRHRRILPERPFWQELPILLVVAVVVAYVVKTFLLQVFFIPSGSMENTLRINDRVLVDKLSFDIREIKRGEILVFNAEGVLAPEGSVAVEPTNPVARTVRSFGSAIGLAPSTETDYIKRVIGLPGDRVKCCDAEGRMTINGVPLAETSYLFPGDVPSTTQFDVVVPEGKMWVMGDHRSASADSRSRIGSPGGGFVPIDRVVGRAFVVSWPFDNIKRLSIPDTFKQSLIEEQKGTNQ